MREFLSYHYQQKCHDTDNFEINNLTSGFSRALDIEGIGSKNRNKTPVEFLGIKVEKEKKKKVKKRSKRILVE